MTLCLVRLMNVGSLVGKQLFEFVEHKHLVHRLQKGISESIDGKHTRTELLLLCS